MAHVDVPGNQLSTRYAEAPRVSFIAHGDARSDVVMAYSSAAIQDPSPVKATRIRFGQVLQFHWIYSEYGLELGNKHDVRFSLIEIVDSELIRRILEEGKFSYAPVGRRLGGVLQEPQVHHYRICFDDHGSYDIVCVTMEIDYFSSMNAIPKE